MKYFALFFYNTESFIESLPEQERYKVRASILSLKLGDFVSVHIKTLKGPIKELIVKKYRIVFFLHKSALCFIGAFVKKTAKTPKREIENAERAYGNIINNFWIKYHENNKVQEWWNIKILYRRRGF